MLSKIRKVLGVVANIMIFGRGKGWWSEKQGPSK